MNLIAWDLFLFVFKIKAKINPLWELFKVSSKPFFILFLISNILLNSSKIASIMWINDWSEKNEYGLFDGYGKHLRLAIYALFGIFERMFIYSKII